MSHRRTVSARTARAIPGPPPTSITAAKIGLWLPKHESKDKYEDQATCPTRGVTAIAQPG
jgi:hypothetical protein